MENAEKETFNYTYSAKEQAEIKAIRNKYVVSDNNEDKMTQLRRLDAAVTQKATTVSLVIGIIGALIMGSGMSLAMTKLGSYLGLSGGMTMLLGIAIGIVGIAILAVAYPMYNHILKRERKKIASRIIQLTDELMR